MRSANAGTLGVSGSMVFQTGTTSSGTSGLIKIQSGSATNGKGGNVVVTVGSGEGIIDQKILRRLWMHCDTRYDTERHTTNTCIHIYRYDDRCIEVDIII